ncbi:AAA family ATPase [Zunongwangia sp. SCSIO 43204]|uniref:AAA family ATPase n=1 Tax=Zunongwangia sp. SCSIO 43204 TaxID=2779359 RepID=UPI001CAA0866|nr:AAA family ATPase [Zunongwangia sp. SCSIO 43204]UAB84354.1 AAA family ATPase [Zunongwangia sp. SCSIO 43204]
METLSIEKDSIVKGLDRDFAKVNKDPLRDAILKAKLNPDDEIVEERPILWINNTGYGTKGNISIFIGKAKSKKSMLVSMFSAALIGCNSITGFEPGEDCSKGVIFDTEQSKRHCQLQYRRINKLHGGEISSLLDYYMLRPYAPEERLKMIEKVIYSNSDISFVVIDGVADLLSKGVNDEEEAIAVTNKLMKWSLERNIHIITILHQNKGDNNAKGHIGSQLVQKSETVLSVEKEATNPKISTVSSPYSRGMEIEPFHFSINDQTGVPYIIEDYSKANSNTKKSISPFDYELEANYFILKEVFKDQSEITFKDLNDLIRYSFSKHGISFGERKCRDWITYFKKENMIYQDKQNKPYKLNKAWHGR